MSPSCHFESNQLYLLVHNESVDPQLFISFLSLSFDFVEDCGLA